MHSIDRLPAFGVTDKIIMKNVAIIYPYIPHYRVPVFEYLHNNSKSFHYVFFAGNNTIDRSIRNTLESSHLKIIQTPIFSVGNLTFQFNIFRSIMLGKFDHFIFLGDPHFVTTWFYALLGRLMNKRVWFWTHGWLRVESGLKRFVRIFFYKLADGLMLYGERARTIGESSGFPKNRLYVIYNSLNYSTQLKERTAIESTTSSGVSHSRFGKCYFACIARLTEICKLEQAIEAIAMMKPVEGTLPELVLIGDGSARSALEKRALATGVTVHFLGELYDEEVIGPVLYHARAVVSPGKVGLTAMHSLAYGTPVISHGDLDRQMPEAEAIIPGVTGDYFVADNVADLSATLSAWAHRPRTEAERAACIELIERRYSPEAQFRYIEDSLRNL